MPCRPSSMRAWRTSSSLNGLMIAITSFIFRTPPCLRLQVLGHVPSSRANSEPESSRVPTRLDAGKSLALMSLFPAPPGVRGDRARQVSTKNRQKSPIAQKLPCLRDSSLPDQVLLCRGGHKLPVTGEQHAPAKGTAGAGNWAVLGIKQPAVGAEFPVEPNRVVEARKHQIGIEH